VKEKLRTAAEIIQQLGIGGHSKRERERNQENRTEAEQNRE
jgi:hypothetical protein